MNSRIFPVTVVLIGALVLAGCGGSPQASSQAPTTTTAHPALADKTSKPKGLEAVIEIDMREFDFASPQREKNPTFRLPSGKTVGIHIHNEGAILHELALGRKVKGTEGYSEVLTQMVPVDVFFYYGQGKAELEGAKFSELEVDSGIKDIWLRLVIPGELKGEWEIGCFVEGHYEQGMHTRLIIE
jgi:uncharacterized cupredoxin-like copper-binding protein